MNIENSIRRLLRRKPWLVPLRLFSGKANVGYCTICNRKGLFVEYTRWLRDDYHCVSCWSIPRQRALIKVLNEQFADWPSWVIHESSPGGSSSQYIERTADKYLPTQFFPDTPPGTYSDGVRCENLEKLTFPDDSFDCVVTQDVMEHVLCPDKAFAEIARTLKPGGAHIFTVPLYRGRKTRVRARLTSLGIEHLEEPQYHGNPIDSKGSLVIREWGDDLLDFIETTSGLKTEVYTFSDRWFGLEAEFLDVFVSQKTT